MTQRVFNVGNADHHKSGGYPLFLGDDLGLYDSVNRQHSSLFDLYKAQKAQDWSEDEVNLTQDRQDFEACSKNTYDIMVKTIMFQWEADSIASRSIINLLFPFITNSEYSAMVMKQSEIEILHALTYSEIVRQCIKDSKSVIDQVMSEVEVLQRCNKIEEVFNQTLRMGAEYNLGLITDKREIRKQLARTVTALLGLEAIQFMASFANTFSLCEQGMFMGVGQLVQKIMLDEILHTKMDFATLDILIRDPEWQDVLEEVMPEVQAILDAIVEQEFKWADYIFSEGRSIVGLNSVLLKEWVMWNAQPIYDYFGLVLPQVRVGANPLPWMDKYMDPDKQQNANQEMDNTAYRLNVTQDDLGDDDLEF